MRREFSVLALAKGEEKYVYIYDHGSRPALMNVLREHAAESGLSLTWFDAAVLIDKLREQICSEETPSRPRHSRV